MNEELAELFVTLDVVVSAAMESHEPDIHAVNNAIQDIKDYLTANPECNNTYHHSEGYDCCN